MYTCAQCAVHACTKEKSKGLPQNCPMAEEPKMEAAFLEYEKEENKQFYITCSAIEALGYGQWSRVKETMEFCKNMGYKKIGLAFCAGLSEEAKVVNKILHNHGFEVVSVACKVGGIDKKRIGLADAQKVNGDTFEPMCNPVAQAQLLNDQNTEFNIMIGLCVGHDSMFYKYSKAMVTTLVAKDRVLAHNPAGALYCAGGYYKSKL